MSEQSCIRLAVQALLEVVDSGAKNMEICVSRSGGVSSFVPESDIDVYVKSVEAEADESKMATSPVDE